jgi:hypothetical protein
MWFLHTECDFNKQECNFFTQSVILNVSHMHSVIYSRTSVTSTLMSMMLTSTRIIFTCREMFSHECDFYTLSVFLTQTVIQIRMNLMFVCRAWFLHAWVRFLHQKCDFNTQNVTSKRKNANSTGMSVFHTNEYDFDKEKYDYDTIECDSYT